MNAPIRPIWDIFCRVIDNYGDIGVCWRLARQLACEYPIEVRLWVDELSALTNLWPSAKNVASQHLEEVHVLRWEALNESIFLSSPASVVIEAFACDIPQTYQALMAANKDEAPHWINLDYLSAESWVEDCHKLTSISPSNGLKKTFFFPGFTKRTGGLIRENHLIEQQKSWQEKSSWLKERGVTPQKDALLISLFTYENSNVQSLIQAWQEHSTPVHCLIPQGKITHSVNHVLHELQYGELSHETPLIQLGNLTFQSIPFLRQDEYDKLLWSMDINFVRGEDSFVRANWAAHPFIWHIYIQEENAHLEKLSSFLDSFLKNAPAELQLRLRDFWQAWNQDYLTPAHWHALLHVQNEWQWHCIQWREELSKIKDLATQLYESTI